MKSKSLTIKRLIIVTIITLFIWINSLMPGSISSNQSSFFVKYLYPPFKSILSEETFTFLIRKLAHFSEYMILSFALIYFYKSIFKDNKIYLLVLTHGFITAIIDELIQTFIPNRAGLITDVLIDTSGVLFAIIVCLVINQIKVHKKRVKK